MSRRIAWGMWAVTMLLIATGISLVVATRSVPAPVALLFRGSEAIIAAVTVTVGVLIASRRPSNPIGWLFLAAGLAVGLIVASEHYVVYTLLAGHRLPGAIAAAWLQGWIGVPGLVTTLAFLFLLFPDGTLPSRRWRPVAWFVALGALVFMVGWWFRPGPLDVLTFADNPIGVGGRSGRVISAIATAGEKLVLFSVLLSVPAMIVRFRGSTGVMRQQMKWLVSATGFVALMMTVAIAFGVDRLGFVTDVLFLASFCSVPVATGVAVLRYRLYEIERIISRTVVYALLTGVLGAVYLAAVVLLQQLFRPLVGGGDLAIAGSTLAVAAVFRPARRRIQAFVDRRFNRTRYDAARTLEAFSARLRDEIDLDSLSYELVAVVRETMQPAHVSLWLRAPARAAR